MICGYKEILKDWMPPAMLRVLRGMGGAVTWSGDYASWAAAREASTGYDSAEILERVKSSLLKVASGAAAYERDSVLFREVQYSWPLLAALMWIAAQNRGELGVLDFGGSLGTTYFQNRRFLTTLAKVQWSIVEQERFVEAGKRHFEDGIVRFYYDIEGCLKDRGPNTILFSSVIQYLDNAYDLLERVTRPGFEYIVFDRTPFVPGPRDRLTVQRVSRKIYRASYPCRFFAKERFRALLQGEFEIVAEFESSDRANIPSSFEGLILKRRQRGS